MGADGWDDAPAINPATDAFAFHNVRPSNPEAGIHIANGDGTGRFLVPGTTGNDSFPAWSADGEWISFLRHGVGNFYYRIRPDGSGLTQLTSMGPGDITSQAVWSPDQISLYAPLKAGTARQRLYQIAADGSGAATPLPLSDGDEITWVGTVRPLAIAFDILRQAPGPNEVQPAGTVDEIVVEFSRPIVAASLSAENFRLAAVAPDGAERGLPAQLSVRADQFAATLRLSAPLPEGVYRIDVAAQVQDVTGLPLGQNHAWTFRVQRESFIIAYGRRDGANGTIWLAAEDGSFDRPVTTGWRPRLSRDGRYLIFLRGGNPDNFIGHSVFVRDLQSGDEKLVFENPFDYVNYFDWLPDMSGLVFDYSGGISAVARDGLGGRRDFASGADGWDDAPAVNPLSAAVVAHNGRPGNPDGGLHIFSSDGTNRRHVANTGVPDLWPDWSGDGQWISFEHYGPIHNYYKVRPDGSEETPLTNLAESAGDSPAIWAPDGNALFIPATVEGVPGIYRVPAQKGGLLRRIPITPGPPVHWVGGVVRAVPPP